MTDKVKEKWKQKLRHMKKEDYIVLLLAGVLLLMISLPLEKEKKNGEEKTVDDVAKIVGNDTALQESSLKDNISYDLDVYVENLEKRAEKIISGMEGAGRSQVMLTVSDTGMEILERDKESTTSDLEETDNAGGSRKNTENGQKEEIVYGKDAAGNETPYVVQRRLPQVTGVVVIAEGAGSAKVKENIIGAVSVLFNLNEHRIKVIRMKS